MGSEALEVSDFTVVVKGKHEEGSEEGRMYDLEDHSACCVHGL